MIKKARATKIFINSLIIMSALIVVGMSAASFLLVSIDGESMMPNLQDKEVVLVDRFIKNDNIKIGDVLIVENEGYMFWGGFEENYNVNPILKDFQVSNYKESGEEMLFSDINILKSCQNNEITSKLKGSIHLCDKTMMLTPEEKAFKVDINEGLSIKRVVDIQDINNDGTLDFYIRGDNRDNSLDSKDLGFVDGNFIYGKMVKIIK